MSVIVVAEAPIWKSWVLPSRASIVLAVVVEILNSCTVIEEEAKPVAR